METIFKKIKEVLFRHKTRIETLENKIAILEKRIESLENDPWKMPFD